MQEIRRKGKKMCAIRFDEFLANLERYKRLLPPDEPIVLPKREAKRRAANKEKRTRVVFECTPEQFAAFHAQLKRYRELIGNLTIAHDVLIGYLAYPTDDQVQASAELYETWRKEDEDVAKRSTGNG